jgi:hypothetical protein
MSNLGERMLTVAFSIKGKLSEQGCKLLIKRIMAKIEVSPAHDSITYKYPLKGKGGQGWTFIQPITESFIAYDAWPDYKGAYLIICSCRIFWIRDVISILKKSGYKILDTKINELSLIVDELTTGD